MALLVRSLAVTAPKQPNFRGVLVYNGLGIVWFIWLLSFWVGAHLLVAMGVQQPGWVAYCVPLFPLLSVSCALGLLDDWVGDNNAKGFRGHFRALGQLVLTTGGLKMFGIGFSSLFTAVSLYWDGFVALPRVILVTVVIALMANFMNLFDLRPGRCGKVYLLGLLLAMVALLTSEFVHLDGYNLVAFALAGFGPLLAVWRFDVGEKGMLGDAGANSMGAFLGYVYATSLPLWLLAILALVLLALNIISEKVSFSAVIESNRFLAFLDGLGRK
jgi:hypothetical protein